MRAFNQTPKMLRLLFVAMLCTTLIPCRSLADDKGAGHPPAKPAPAKPDSPAPLTERERWMLDRIDQLEKRMAELESRSAHGCRWGRGGRERRARSRRSGG